MVQALEEIIAKSSSVVFFGGAGVSQEYDEKAKVIEELKSDLYNAFGIDE